MWKEAHWKKHLFTALELPGDLAGDEAIVTLIGSGEAMIENYRSLLRYTEEEIMVSTRKGRVTVCGTHLEIPCYMPHEMKICGNISGIYLERR